MLASWGWQKTTAFLIPFILLGVGAMALFFLRKTLRTRVRIAQQLRSDPDINEWLVVFGWSRKVLYVPTIAVSLIGWLAMLLRETDVAPHISPAAVGGIWLAVDRHQPGREGSTQV